jgi:hypothetical protein
VGAAIALWMLLFFGVDSTVVQLCYMIHDVLFGSLLLVPIIVLSVLQVPGRIQTWLLFNNALSQGVVINQILRGREDSNDDTEVTQRIKKLEQQLAATKNLSPTATASSTALV